MNTERSKFTEEEILLEFSVEHQHNREILEHYLREYPEFSQALVDCAIALTIDTSDESDESTMPPEQAVERAWQQFQAGVRSKKNTATANPFTQLSTIAFKSVAKRLDINSLLLARFRDRAIDVTTIPVRFIQRLAIELDAPFDVMSTYLRSPPTIAAGQSFRSSLKPQVTGQISFKRAVETSQLTAEQQQALIALED